jgi:type I restriction enzyme R subunit
MNNSLPVEITQQTLPHWIQPGASSFFTFRLADSVPQALLGEWIRERVAWLEHHPQPWTQADA